MKTNTVKQAVKHTPGPWKQHQTADKIYASVRGLNNETVADCGSRSDLKAQANATLIAAAPELHDENTDTIACLESLYKDHPEIAGEYFGAFKLDRMKALQAKAEGRA